MTQLLLHLPDDLVRRFKRVVAARQRSMFVRRLLEAALPPDASGDHPADIQDRHGAPLVLSSARYLYPWLRHVFADGAYNGAGFAAGLDKIGRWTCDPLQS